MARPLTTSTPHGRSESIRRIGMVTAVLLLTAGCDKGGEFEASSGTIGGRATVAGESTPVAGATVEIGIPTLTGEADASAVTNQNGEFSARVSWLKSYENPSGMVGFVLKVSKADFETVLREGTAFASDGVYYEVAMTPTSACIWPVEVSVTSGVSPTFSWTPSCAMWRVIVRADNTSEEHWRLSSFSENVISPTVTFGATVPGASSYLNAALSPGQPYTISLYRWTGPGPEDGELAGQQTFSP